MTSTADKLVADYLKRLDRELTGFPRARRRELVQEIEDHIAEARAGLETENEAAVRTLLDRLGDAADIAAEAQERSGSDVVPVSRRTSGWDIVALILLFMGGVIIPVFGWFVGVVLLWASAAWSTRDKLIGTLVVPGGLALPGLLATLTWSAESCDGGPGIETTCTGGNPVGDVVWALLAVTLLVASCASVLYLAWRRARTMATA
jgi:hypothetical protein